MRINRHSMIRKCTSNIFGQFALFLAALRTVAALLLVVRVARIAPVFGTVTAVVIIATRRCRLAFLRVVSGIAGEDCDDFTEQSGFLCGRILFGGFFVLVIWGLVRPADCEVASAFIGKPLPEFALQAAVEGQPGLVRADLANGQPHLLNIFASWCVPCAVEAPQLAQLRRQGAEVVGVAIRDRPEELAAFLARNGNPFTRIGADNLSSIQFALGSSGVPESFVIDGKGVIRYQHIGDIRPEDVPLILRKLAEAQ